jgi:hypothetical protein
VSFHSYRGQASATRPQNVTAAWSQARTRHPQRSYDQHGRAWSYSADNKNGMPTSILSPEFQAPWTPDQQYLRINPDNTTELYLDYPLMYRDRKAALKSFHKEAVRYAQRKGQPSPKMGQYTPEIVEAIGAPPRALELIAAAFQEHPWVLGTTPVEDPRLVQFLETTSPDLEAEIEEFDFSPESYAAAIAGKQPASRRARPVTRPAATQIKTGSLTDLELAAAGIDADEQSAMEAAARDAALEQLHGTAEGASDEDFGAMGLEDDVAGAPAPANMVAPDEGDEEGITEDDDDVDEEDEELDRLMDIDEQHDPEARGGQRVHPRKTALAEKQGARRPSQTAVPRKRATARSAGKDAAPAPEKASRGKAWDPDKAKGKSLADGAKPYTGG